MASKISNDFDCFFSAKIKKKEKTKKTYYYKKGEKI